MVPDFPTFSEKYLGQRLFTQGLPSLVVLPGGARAYSTVLSEVACMASRVEIRGESAGHDLFLALGPARCGR